MLNQESLPYKGGVLADEMGMGKTLQVLFISAISSRQPLFVFVVLLHGLFFSPVMVLHSGNSREFRWRSMRVPKKSH